MLNAKVAQFWEFNLEDSRWATLAGCKQTNDSA